MADVGNGHDQAEAFAALFGVHGVVEVAGGFAVDGHQRQVAQVNAALDVFLAHLLRGGHGLGHGFFAEHVRQVVLAQRDFDFHARVGVVTQHFADLHDGLTVRVGVIDDIHHHHLAVLGAAVTAGFHQHLLAHAAVFGYRVPHTALAIDAGDQAGGGAFQHLDDAAFGTATAVGTARTHHDTVAVHHLVHFAFGQVNVVAFAALAHGETVTITVAGDAAGNQVEFLCHAELALAVDQDLAGTLHRAQASLEQVQFVLVNRESGRQLLCVHRHAIFFEEFENEFAAR